MNRPIGQRETWLARPARQLAELAALAACAYCAAAGAHHSFAMFDTAQHHSVSGTVRSLEWTNPHVWLWVDVDDGKGGTVAWGFEAAAPGELARTGGWTKHSVAPGEKVTVRYSPLRDGRPGGSLEQVTRADGSSVGRAGDPPGPPGPPPAQ